MGDDKGRTKLSDFGLACKISSKGLSGAYGTRGYWAPEMLRRDNQGKRLRYGKGVDWFSFGCVIYEMITGHSPFRTEIIYEFTGLTKKDKNKAIDLATMEMNPDFTTPNRRASRPLFDKDTIDICSKLLEKNPAKRLGSGEEGAFEIMFHPFFTQNNGLKNRNTSVSLLSNTDDNKSKSK